MRVRRVLTALAAATALAGVPVSAHAQSPTPSPAAPSPTPAATSLPAQATATPSATPFPANSARGKAVQRVYDDYRRDGVIEPCRHTQQALQDALDTLDPSFDQDYPDFREALEAGIDRHKAHRCKGATQGSATPTPTPTASAAPRATVTPAPTTTPGSTSTPESGALPGGGGGGGGSDSGGGTGGDDNGTTSPPVSGTPAPGVTPAPVAPVSTPAPETVVQPSTNTSALTLPRILLAIALIGAALLGLTGMLAARGGRLAPLRHAWREAGLRSRGTWNDFADWLKLGR